MARCSTSTDATLPVYAAVLRSLSFLKPRKGRKTNVATPPRQVTSTPDKHEKPDKLSCPKCFKGFKHEGWFKHHVENAVCDKKSTQAPVKSAASTPKSTLKSTPKSTTKSPTKPPTKPSLKTCSILIAPLIAFADEKKMKRYAGSHDDDCAVCGDGGDVMCCEFCSNTAHVSCHDTFAAYERSVGNSSFTMRALNSVQHDAESDYMCDFCSVKLVKLINARNEKERGKKNSAKDVEIVYVEQEAGDEYKRDEDDVDDDDDDDDDDVDAAVYDSSSSSSSPRSSSQCKFCSKVCNGPNGLTNHLATSKCRPAYLSSLANLATEDDDQPYNPMAILQGKKLRRAPVRGAPVRGAKKKVKKELERRKGVSLPSNVKALPLPVFEKCDTGGVGGLGCCDSCFDRFADGVLAKAANNVDQRLVKEKVGKVETMRETLGRELVQLHQLNEAAEGRKKRKWGGGEEGKAKKGRTTVKEMKEMKEESSSMHSPPPFKVL